MKFFAKRQPEDVHEWLVIATRDLIPSEQKRVWAEILEHYAESVATHQEDGLPETEAQKAAFAELGDVYEAQKGFRKMYLLESEAKRLRRLLNESKPLTAIIAFLNTLIWAFAAFLIHRDFGNERPILKLADVFGIALTFFFPIIVSVVSIRFSKRLSVSKNAVLITIVNWTSNLGIYLVMLHLSPHSWYIDSSFVIIFLFFLADPWRTIRLSRKIPPHWLKQVPD